MTAENLTKLQNLAREHREYTFKFSDCLLRLDKNRKPAPDYAGAAVAAAKMSTNCEEVQAILSKAGL